MEHWEVEDGAYERITRCKRTACQMQTQAHAQVTWKAFQESAGEHLRAASFQQLMLEAQWHNVSAPRVGSFPSWSNNRNGRDQQLSSLWVQHEKAWKKVMQDTVMLDVSNVPWPPAMQDMLECMAHVEDVALDDVTSKQTTSAATSSTLHGARTTLLMRRAYAKACLRWHPDKFRTRLVAMEDESLKQQLVARATLVFQTANNQWAVWVKQHKESSVED